MSACIHCFCEHKLISSSQMSMNVVMEFMSVSKSATTPMVPITASATKVIGSVMTAMPVKVSMKLSQCSWCV